MRRSQHLFDAGRVEQAERGVQGLAETSVGVVEHRSGMHDDTDPKLALQRAADVVLGQQQAESRDHASQQHPGSVAHRMDQRQEAVAPVGEPVPVAGLDARRAQRCVEQRVHRLAEFGLDVIRAASGALDVEGDDGSLMSPGPARQTVPGELPARQRSGRERSSSDVTVGMLSCSATGTKMSRDSPGFALLLRLRKEPYRLHVVQGRVVARQGQKSPYMAITCDYSG